MPTRGIALTVLLVACAAEAAPAPFRPEPVAVVGLDYAYNGSITPQRWVVLFRSRDACRWAVAHPNARKLACLKGRADPAGWLRANSRVRLMPDKPPFRLELSGCSLAEARTLAEVLCYGAGCAAVPEVPALLERQRGVWARRDAYVKRLVGPRTLTTEQRLRLTPAQKKQLEAYYHESEWCRSRALELGFKAGWLHVSGEVRPYRESEKP